ncbi:MAG: 2-oxo-3-(phosphooxy)propyl 3-oxoalkanoate synthase [Acidimicrobiaceae bacterium]|nr:2-oxo-3-(phosphooxy)propyl 3-oxoalkanoate synthase [Acidimicrobiaceae bacterium]MDQ1376616.1 2-oxo-3-(phosphooxy)propyl 3-oxoalkanoate synthase [Acidimicrobiaceae bacterium]MDQ1414247.1 2-oxo-3-(phosphooxy)propyl 3-oxoalkanoate synthase [Acidimicrobiaceae bacterium]MDQ1415183.1 2-oxo-3-(phosphooxy)propyl 3-oxoalkanoate synthase [Acidimicrobiaceae bacterium]
MPADTFLEPAEPPDDAGSIRHDHPTNRPQWSQTIPRDRVHRASVAEVFLTSLDSTGEPDSFLLGAQWPRTHSFYRPDRLGRQDPMLVAETLRQTGLAIAHCHYGTPLGYQFIMCDMHYAIANPRVLQCGPAPTNLILRAACSQIRRKGDLFKGATVSIRAVVQQVTVALAWATMRCLPPSDGHLRSHGANAALPGTEPLRPLTPSLVGRREEADVLLGQPEPGAAHATWPLRIDPNHPALFDHPLDHIPGMAQLEAARQAALAVTKAAGHQPLVVSCHAVFQRPGRLDSAAWCHATVLDNRTYDGPENETSPPGRTVQVAVADRSATLSVITLTMTDSLFALPEPNSDRPTAS